MAARKSRVKDTYWHKRTGFGSLQGMKPAKLAKKMKEVFPVTNVTGRKIYAYQRRLVSEVLLVPDKLTMSINDMMIMAKDLVSTEDKLVYDCAVGSQIQSLKCFEYKLTAEETDELEAAERWIKNLKK